MSTWNPAHIPRAHLDERSRTQHLQVRRLGERAQQVYSIGRTPTQYVDVQPSRRLSDLFRPPSPVFGTVDVRPRAITAGPDLYNTVTDQTRGVSMEAFASRPVIADFSRYPATSELINNAVPMAEETAARVETMEEVDRLALFENQSISYQKALFLIVRYPALILSLLPLWFFWGRGLDMNTVQPAENIAYILSITVGLLLLVENVFFSYSNYGSYPAAKFQTYMFHIFSISGMCLAVAAILFSAQAIPQVSDISTQTTCRFTDPTYAKKPLLCLTKDQRNTFLSTIIGSSSAVVLLLSLAVIYGVIGQIKMKPLLKKFFLAHQDAIVAQHSN